MKLHEHPQYHAQELVPQRSSLDRAGGSEPCVMKEQSWNISLVFLCSFFLLLMWRLVACFCWVMEPITTAMHRQAAIWRVWKRNYDWSERRANPSCLMLACVSTHLSCQPATDVEPCVPPIIRPCHESSVFFVFPPVGGVESCLGPLPLIAGTPTTLGTSHAS